MYPAVDDHGHAHGGSGWEAYWEIMTDPAHFWAEMTFTFLDIIILSPIIIYLWTKFRQYLDKRFHRQHQELDLEHGHCHAPEEYTDRPNTQKG